MSEIKRYGKPKAGGLPISKAVKAGEWLYVSGQVPRDEKGDLLNGSMKQEATLAFKNMVSVLESAGYGVNDVVRVGVWIDDPRDFPEFNKVFASIFSPEHAPARVTIQSAMMCDCRVEVDCIAWKS